MFIVCVFDITEDFEPYLKTSDVFPNSSWYFIFKGWLIIIFIEATLFPLLLYILYYTIVGSSARQRDVRKDNSICNNFIQDKLA